MRISKRTVWLALSGAFIALLLAFLWPLPRAISHPQDLSPVTVLDRQGRVLYEARDEDFGSQKHLRGEDTPPLFVTGLLLVEDRSFDYHLGISIRGIVRAAIANYKAGRVVSGGSTITQQLVRIRLNPARRNIAYKLREMWLALKLDARLTKGEILSQYIDSVYFGHQAYGLLSAAEVYFGKEPDDLSFAEIALLIGIIKSPVSLDPFVNPEGALERRAVVLDVLADQGVMTKDEAEHAKQEKLSLNREGVTIEAPHFVFWVLAQHPEIAPGSAIETTLDGDLQREVEDIVERKVLELADFNVTSAAVVVLDAKNGDILSMVGSNNYFDEAHDGAVNVALSSRQPGSSLKPFTYALALAQGDTPATTVEDTEVQFLTEEGNPYNPRNYDYDLHGLVRYREALANSYNVSAVKVLERVGVPRLLTFLRKAGITTLTKDPEFYGLALTLGSGEVRLLELVQAYSIFPRGGKTLRARVLPTDPVDEGDQIITPQVAWLISDILSDPSARLPQFGDAEVLSVPPHQIAAKTGTTRNTRDNWVVGYTPSRIVGVWVGNADNTPMKGTSGITGAGPIFHDVMQEALRGIPFEPFAKPSGILQKTICTTSGKLPTKACPHTMEEVFVAGTEPKEPDDIHRLVKIDIRNGLLAGGTCDARFIREESFAVYPPAVRQWARDRGVKQMPTAYSPLCGGGEIVDDAELEILRPLVGDAFLLDPLIPDEDEKISFTARAPLTVETVEWKVDGKLVGKASAPDFRIYWAPTVGTHTVTVSSGNLSQSRKFSVELSE